MGVSNFAAVPVPANGFVATGTIKPFTFPVEATYYVYQGPPPTGVVVDPTKPLIYERAIYGAIKISDILANLKNTPFDALSLSNIQVTHQNYPMDAFTGSGWFISTDLVIDQSTGILYDLMRSSLNMKDPGVHLSLMICNDRPDFAWTSPVHLPSFILVSGEG